MCFSGGFFVFVIKMHATDAKMQKIKPDPNFFYDGRKFRRQCVMALTLENKINSKNLTVIWFQNIFKNLQSNICIYSFISKYLI